MDAIIISTDVATISTTATAIPEVWADNQMCHPVFHPVPLQLPLLPVFLPHPWAPHLPPAQWPPTQHQDSHPVATTSTHIHVVTIQTSGLSISPKPPSPTNNYSSYKKAPILPLHPNTPPIDAYITATEQASSKLLTQEADEFRSDVNRLLKQQQQQHNNHCNLNPAQHRALTELKQDNTRVWYSHVDKGVAMVIMDQQDYNNKAQALLQDTNTYKVLNKDPTPHLKNKLINLLKDIKQSGGLNTQKYKQLYPTSAVPPKFYGLPKIHKAGTPLRPIVSSRGSITYGVAKELSHIIKPLVGQSPHHLKNTQHFIQQLQGKRLETGNHHLIWCQGPLHLCTSTTFNPNCQTKVTAGQHSPTKDFHVHLPNHFPTGVLPYPHLLPLPG